jgi:radical SAM protein with 4Fe4S-binding SPASM domain
MEKVWEQMTIGMKKRFKKVYIEITNRCNLRCHFCASSKAEGRFITIAEFRHIAAQVRPFSDYIYLHVLGEPLLHPALLDILDIAENEQLKVNLTTNGTLLGELVDNLIKKPALRQMNISLHSKGGFVEQDEVQLYVDSMLKFAERFLHDSAVIISLRLWNITSEIRSEADFNMMVIRKIVAKFPGWDADVVKWKGKEGHKISDRLYLNTDQVFEWPHLSSHEVGTEGFCYGLRDQIAILADGTVVPCCLDCHGVIHLGNIHRQPMEEIISGERSKQIRECFLKRIAIEELCRKCSFRQRFTTTLEIPPD